MQTDVFSPKQAAALKALDFVKSGMKLGLGTGSTAALFVAALGERVAAGLQIVGVPTSQATFRQASALKIPLTTLEDCPELDLTIDGADEFDPQFRLIKGGGGALLREKIVAATSRNMVVITDSSKQVDHLGRFPLPVEVNPFGIGATTLAVRRVAKDFGCVGAVQIRGGNQPYLTDGGHYIIDCAFGVIQNPEALSAALFAIPGVVEHGLFIGLASTIIVAGSTGAHVLTRP
ncbi:MAG: ribose-5-phosphate isomerase RpiA [Hyphomicrobiales bacterium]|nr:ribose-5-phosphate isomerase RpiA [Hyphomicrobiales bacterium]MDE2113983.1 ribose-5-phosphate isomerase RpiA [Hyphomicrobiales bacterium]